MRYAQIENGRVVNIVEADDAFVHAIHDDENDGREFVEAGDAGIGWLHDGQDFAPPPETLPVPPRVVTMRQARHALLEGGIYSAVADAIAALSSPDREKAEIDWEYATEVRRDAPLIGALKGTLGLSETQIDDLFLLAATFDD